MAFKILRWVKLSNPRNCTFAIWWGSSAQNMQTYHDFEVILIWLLLTAKQCVVGQWSDWGECTASRRCIPTEEREALTKTYQLPASDAWDSGRDAMRYAMMAKEAVIAERTACIAAGECPDTMADRPSSGPFQCVGGKCMHILQ